MPVFGAFFTLGGSWRVSRGLNHSGTSLRTGKWTHLTDLKVSGPPHVGNMGAYAEKFIYIARKWPENGQKQCFRAFFGTFWAITWPINAQWASNWQESQLVCSQSHFDALNTLVGCQELTGVCLRRVPEAKNHAFLGFLGS